jgi:hypothetical protein
MRAHGTNARYHLDECRCDPCRRAARRYEQNRRRQVAYGRWQPYVDAERARQHCLGVIAAGMGPVTIARVSGVPHGAISKLLYGDYTRGMAPSRRIRPETEERLLAVHATLDNLAPAALVDATGTRRRVQALACLGWSASEVARRIGVAPTNFHRTLRKQRVHARTARAVRDLYDQLCMTPSPTPTAASTAQRARANGWIPPLGWDEGDIDDPTARPRVRGAA